MKKIAILTSGGDAPGMNPLIKGLVNIAINNNVEPYLVYEGYYGLYHNQIEKAKKEDIKDLNLKSGTSIYSSRFPEFNDDKYKKVAIQNLKKIGIDSLVVIGGDGSFRGANQLSRLGLQTIGISGTIDNNIAFSDYTTGFLTSFESIVDAIEKIRDTSESHNRVSVVEVMGKGCGDLAVYSAIATNAEVLSLPEQKLSDKEIITEVKKQRKAGKRAIIVLISELIHNAEELTKKIEKETKIETRLNVLSQIQRGGKPTAMERFNAYRIANFAMKQILEDKTNLVVSINENKLFTKNITEVVDSKHSFAKDLLEVYKNIQ